MRALVWESLVTMPDCEPVKLTAGTPRALRAIESSAIEMRSPAESSMSSSRRAGLSVSFLASASSSSVVSPIGETTTTTSLPAAFAVATRSATRRILSPSLMDRYPLPILGRKRGWIVLSQVALLGLGLWLAGVPPRADTVWMIGAIALATGFAAASQDIAYDAYTVEVLRKEEQGAAVGARVALYRAAMFISGGLALTLIGTFLGGLLTSTVGLGRALWITGLLQILSNLGYAVVAQVGPNRLIMYSAVALELGMSGMGTGAFGVLLIRLTQKRFSATQYALLSSLFSIPRVLAGPPAGLLVDALGWRDFFVFTLLAGIPGMAMLWRFVPWSARDPEFQVEQPKRGTPVTPAQVATRAAVGGIAGFGISVLTLALLEAMRTYRSQKVFDLAASVHDILLPAGLGGWLTLVGLVAIALTIALTTAAFVVARRGIVARRAGSGPAGPPPIPIPPPDLDV